MRQRDRSSTKIRDLVLTGFLDQPGDKGQDMKKKFRASTPENDIFLYPVFC